MSSIFKYECDDFYVFNPSRKSTLTKRVFQSFVQDLDEKASVKYPSKTSLSLIDYHNISIEALELEFQTSATKGLDNTLAKERLLVDGINELSPSKNRSLAKWINIIFGGLSGALWLGLILSILSYQPLGSIDQGQPDSSNLILAAIIFMVLLVHTILNYYHYCQINSTIKTFNNFENPEITVIRNQQEQIIQPKYLVKGDLILLLPGLKVPGDIRLIEVDSLKLDRSLLTGEMEWIDGKVYSDHQKFTQSGNIALKGTYVVQGYGKGIVLNIGDKTVVGHINRFQPNSGNLIPSLLAKEFNNLGKFGAILAIALMILNFVFYLAYLRPNYPSYMSISSAATNSTSLLLCFLLDGLSLGLTLTLTILGRRMIKKGILIKELNTIEKVGGLDVLCLDKTGTLTQKSMKASTIILERDYTLTEIQSILDKNLNNLNQLICISFICSFSASKDQPHLGFDQINTMTDLNALKFPDYLTPSKKQLEAYRSDMDISYSKELESMVYFIKSSTLVNSIFRNEEGKRMIMVKGSVDHLLPRCTKLSNKDGSLTEMNNANRNEIYRLANKYRLKGQKLILLAFKIIEPENSNYPGLSTDSAFKLHYTTTQDQGLEARLGSRGKMIPRSSLGKEPSLEEFVYVGIVGIVNAPREGASQVVQVCRKAGIKVLMLTGDHPVSSVAIANEIGMFSTKYHHTMDNLTHPEPSQIKIYHPIVVLGKELSKLDSLQIELLMEYEEILIAKASSRQKVKFIQQLQSLNKVVGMVGDGLNDLPAIKQADVGIAMSSADDVTQAQADVILSNNALAHIPLIIETGRKLLLTAKLLIYKIPAGSLGETLPIFSHLFLGLPSQLSGLMIVIVSLISETLPSIAIMATHYNDEIMDPLPKKRVVVYKDLFLSFLYIGLFDSIVANFSYFLYFYQEAKLTPANLLFLFDKWSISNPKLNVDQSQLNYLTCSSQSIYFITIILLNLIRNVMSTNVSSSSTQRILKFTHTPNLYYLFTATLTIILTLVILYVPTVNNIFSTCPPDPIYWPITIGIAVGSVTFVEASLWIFDLLKLKWTKSSKLGLKSLNT